MWSVGNDSGCRNRGSIPNSKFGPKGFTLLEFIVVLTLLGILSALAAPRIGNGLDTLRLKAAARTVASAIRTARMKALREQQVYWLGIDPIKNVVEIVSEDHKFNRQVALPDGVSIRTEEAPDDMSRESIAYRFFAPNGADQSFSLRLVNRKGRQLQVINGSWLRSPRIEEEDQASESPNVLVFQKP